jgi:ferric iron reductase protein FhuF
MAKVAQINVGQIWGQLPRKFDFFLNQLKGMFDDSSIINRIDSDYELLKYKLNGEVFGRKRNPFDMKQKFIESIEDPTQCVPVESTCCLNYLIKGGKYCYTCPKLKETEREAMREEFRAAPQE